MHTHDTWTLLIVDDGAVRFGLYHHERGAQRSQVTLLPPHVPHDGRAATPLGFRKRVLYLDESLLDARMAGAAVDHPGLRDTALRRRIHQLHGTLAGPGDELEAASRLALIVDRLRRHLGAGQDAAPAVHPTHLVRAFTAEFGIAPHQYLTGRRVDLARRMLGTSPARYAGAR